MPFQKGQSGNPNGSKRTGEWRDAIKRALARRGKANYGEGLAKIADKLVEAAVNGDQWAMKEIGDRIDGKPAQAIEVESHHVVTHEQALTELEQGVVGASTTTEHESERHH